MDTSEFIKDKLRDLFLIVNELENMFPDRRFTLDGHLLGSIGEVLAEYYYGITLLPNSTKTHDGEVNGRHVQIKITQGKSVDINDIPEYLLVLFLQKAEGKVYEVYNGPGDFLKNCQKTKNGWYTRQLTTLSKLDKAVENDRRVESIRLIAKWNKNISN